MKHIKHDNLFKIIFVFCGIILITTAIGLYFKRMNTVRPQPQIQEGMKSIGDVFNDLGNFFTMIPREFEKVGKFFVWIGDVFVALGDYIKCGFRMIVNLPNCSKWYFLQFIGKIVYWPWATIFYLADIQYIEDLLWDIVYSIDEIIYDAIGLHIAHYPDDINDMCYECNVKKYGPKKDKSFPPWPF